LYDVVDGPTMHTFVTVALDGLEFASYLFIVSVGLTVIFGVMRILNVAHGAVYGWGAYVAAIVIGWASAAALPVWAYFVGIGLTSVVVGAAFGLIVYFAFVRRMEGQDEVILLLLTFGLFLALENLSLLVFGGTSHYSFAPVMALGRVTVGGTLRTNYGFSIIGLAALVGVACWYFFDRTRTGRLIRVVIYDREVAETLGVNVNAMQCLTFIGGSVLAALGGAYIAPTISVQPGLGTQIIVMAFAVSVVGGLGSISGAMIGALIIGLLRSVAIHFVPSLELFVIYGVMAAVLLVRPEGLFPPPKARSI